MVWQSRHHPAPELGSQSERSYAEMTSESRDAFMLQSHKCCAKKEGVLPYSTDNFLRLYLQYELKGLIQAVVTLMKTFSSAYKLIQ